MCSAAACPLLDRCSASCFAQPTPPCRYGLSEADLQEVEEQLAELVAARRLQPGGSGALAAAAARDAELLGARRTPLLLAVLLLLLPACLPAAATARDPEGCDGARPLTVQVATQLG